MPDKGQGSELKTNQARTVAAPDADFVLEKSIFSNIFEKDIRRVYIYKKAERLAKAIHLITPAFHQSPSLANRVHASAIGLIDSATLPPGSAKTAISRELLALSSILSMARSSGILSPMNADLIAREAHLLLGEVASYEEPRLFFDDAPSLAGLLRQSEKEPTVPSRSSGTPKPRSSSIGHVSDKSGAEPRRDAILAVIKEKGTVYIKDLSTVIREVSEKTIQRELQKLVIEGVISKKGDRRWTAYSLV